MQSDYDPEPFVVHGKVLKSCRDCGRDLPLSEFVSDEMTLKEIEDAPLPDVCAECRDDDRRTDLMDEIAESRYGSRLCRGFEMLGGGDE